MFARKYASNNRLSSLLRNENAQNYAKFICSKLKK